MSNEITFLGVDLDEATVRRVLEILPGVEPVALDELDESDASDTEGDDGRESGTGDRDRRRSGRTTESGAASGTEPTSGRTGAGPRERARGNPDAGPTVEGAESDTPWPGSPFAGTEDDDEEGRNWKRILIAVGLVLGLGVIGVGAVWAYREWKREDGVGGIGGHGDEAKSSGPLDAAASAVREGQDGASDESETGASERADSASRMPSMDLDPIVGMAFLAGAAVLLKRLSDRE